MTRAIPAAPAATCVAAGRGETDFQECESDKAQKPKINSTYMPSTPITVEQILEPLIELLNSKYPTSENEE
jgi:hypothetical protein